MICGKPLLELLLSPWVFIIILVSVVSIGTIFDRLIFFARTKLDTLTFTRRIKELVKDKEIERAITLCEATRHPLCRITKTLLQSTGLPRAAIYGVVKNAAEEERRNVEAHVGVLNVLAFIAPLLGLLGTVVGIVQAFSVVATAGGGTTEMMGGIGVALVTTACGIIVAVPAAIFFSLFGGKADTMDANIKVATSSILRSVSSAGLIDKTVVQKIRGKIVTKERPNPSAGSEALMPGINVALLVVCFFMIFVPNMYQTNFTVSTPALSKVKEEKKEEKTELKLTVHLARDGTIYINNAPTPADTGVQNNLMRELLKRSLQRMCILSADEGLYHGQVVELMDRVTQCGAEKVCLLKRRSEE